MIGLVVTAFPLLASTERHGDDDVGLLLQFQVPYLRGSPCAQLLGKSRISTIFDLKEQSVVEGMVAVGKDADSVGDRNVSPKRADHLVVVCLLEFQQGEFDETFGTDERLIGQQSSLAYRANAWEKQFPYVIP